MSYANGTTHYNLPQTTGTDKRDWSDTNQAFQDIDAALYQTTQDTAQAAIDIEALEVRMDTAEQNIATNAGDISALDGRVTTVEGTVAQHTGQIADVRQDLEDMICAYNEASATSTHAYAVGDYFIYNDVLYRAIQPISIGTTIVPDTNCTTTNVSSELLSKSDRVLARFDGNNYATLNDLLAAVRAFIVSVSNFSVKNISLFTNIEGRYRSVFTLSDFEYVNDDYATITFNSTASDSGTLHHRILILRNTGTHSEYSWRITTGSTTVTPTDVTQPSTSKWLVKITN